MSLLPQNFFHKTSTRRNYCIGCDNSYVGTYFIFCQATNTKGWVSPHSIWIEFQTEIDQLTATVGLVENEIQPFNPNFISDYKAYVLNIPPEAIDRLRKFRADDKWINSCCRISVGNINIR